MPVRRESSGRRSVAVTVEVPGTPDQVWEAVATGPGVSSWFCPTTIDGRVGGSLRCRPPHQEEPGLGYRAEVTVWDPPRRFGTEGPGLDPSCPPITSLWSVEPVAADNCVVRVEHSLVSETDQWDAEIESAETGWPIFFHVLRLYLARFRGRPVSMVRVLGQTLGSPADAFRTMLEALGAAGLSPGQRWSFLDAEGGLPRTGGVVDRVETGGDQPFAVLRLDDPAPGIGVAGAFAMGEIAFASLGIYLYGDEAARPAARDQPHWKSWMQQVFTG